MDTTNDTNQPSSDEQEQERQTGLVKDMLVRFGPRTHLQPKEIAKLMGLKTRRPINDAITSGALPATILPGCDRLRFVALDDFLTFMRTHQPYGVKPQPVVDGAEDRRSASSRERAALARVAREGSRKARTHNGARSL
jgi:hypothetical protein